MAYQSDSQMGCFTEKPGDVDVTSANRAGSTSQHLPLLGTHSEILAGTYN